jgi:hypothetical protein
MDIREEVFHVQQADDNVIHVKMCKCGRAPHRKKARNCHFCHKEANKKYRRSLKEDAQIGRSVRLMVVAKT